MFTKSERDAEVKRLSAIMDELLENQRLEAEERRAKKEAKEREELRRLMDQVEQKQEESGFAFEQTRKTKKAVDEVFKHAAEKGSLLEGISAKADKARESCAANVVTVAYRDQVVSQCAAEADGVRKECRAWFDEQKAELEEDLLAAFSIDAKSVDAGKALFFLSTVLRKSEVESIAVESMSRSDATTLRMLEANAKRSGVPFTNPVDAYIVDVLSAFESACDYAESTFLAENSKDYRANLDGVFKAVDALLAKAEKKACLPCVA